MHFFPLRHFFLFHWSPVTSSHATQHIFSVAHHFVTTRRTKKSRPEAAKYLLIIAYVIGLKEDRDCSVGLESLLAMTIPLVIASRRRSNLAVDV
jgi:hypothetical protein